MEIQIFTIHDSKAQAFITPWFSQTTETAKRQFTSACRDSSTDFHKYPGDYTLFHLGTFNQESCKFELLKTPENLGLAISYVGKSKDWENHFEKQSSWLAPELELELAREKKRVSAELEAAK